MAIEMNFFSWLRKSVKQSVLMGVSDAIEDLGTSPAMENLPENMAALLQRESTGVGIEKRGAGAAKAGGRKRLGRSLKDFEAPGEA